MSSFRVNKERKVWWPAVVSVAIDGGETVEFEFELYFRLMSTDQVNSLTRFPGRITEDEYVSHFYGWKNIEDEDGNDLPFSREAFQQALQEYPFAEACGNAIAEASTGRAATKNSESGSAG